ncbi:MAG: DUF4831 family protein [Bacteroidales bacterium]|jgi:hypothetical protein|nr:DUF4831 family protein [Bacteroidales bacterium]
MKNNIFIIALLMFCSATAQTYTSFPVEKSIENFSKNSIYYNVSETELLFEITIEKNIRHKGIFANSAYLLGLTNVPMADDTLYSIKNINLKSQMIAGKFYVLQTDGAVNVEKNMVGGLKRISVGKNNKAVNDNSKERKFSKHEKIKFSDDTTKFSMQSIPIYEKYFMSKGMLDATASLTPENAVERIKTLREEQIKILSDGLDGTYLNTTIDFMYKQLDEIINGYVAMFAGTEQKTEEKVLIRLSPKKPIIMEEDLILPLCTFSPTVGVVKITNPESGNVQIDYSTIVAKFHSYNTTKPLVENLKKQKNDAELQKKISKDGVGVYYAIPEKVAVSIEFGNINIEKVIDIIQFGVTTFTVSHKQNIEFDIHTGELISASN